MSSSPTFDAFFGTATSNPGETRAPYDYQRRLANELQRERFIAALTGSPNPQVYWRGAIKGVKLCTLQVF